MRGDLDTVVAYYMFVNHGWAPSQYDALPLPEKLLLWEFIQKEVAARNRK